MTREEFLRQDIAKYKKKIETYQAIIAEHESELGMSHNPVSFQSPGATTKNKGSDVGDPLSLIQGMIFFNKSQSEAAKAFLEMVGYPLKTGLLLEAVEKGGLKIGGKTPIAKKQNFYTILHRSADVGLAAKDTWGLVSWPGVTKRAADEVEQDNNGDEDSKKTSGNDPKPS